MTITYLLYLDDSGSVRNQKEEHFVLAGLILHENSLFWINKRMNELAGEISNQAPETVEFHASEIYCPRGKEPWETMTRENRVQTQKEVLKIIANESKRSGACILAAVINKKENTETDPMKTAFEDLCSRFDKYIARIHKRDGNNKEKGLIIIDKSEAYESVLQDMMIEFRRKGTKWNERLNSIPEVPLFVNSKTSRPIQAADHIAYSVFRRYERGDAQYFDIIQSCFDKNGPQIYGLSHITKNKDCTCPSCLSRQMREYLKKQQS